MCGRERTGTEYLPPLAADLGLLEKTEHTELKNATTEVKRMLTSLISKLKADR